MLYQPVELYYESYGKGFPIVFLHGFALSHVIWKPLIPDLKAEARLIFPDLRGHGNSPAPEGPYTVRMMAEDVVALLDKLGLDKAIWVGHSMGGYLCQAAARDYLERVAAVAFVTTRSQADTADKIQGRLKTIDQVRQYGARVVAEDMSEKLAYKETWKNILFKIIDKTPPAGVIGSLQAMASRPDSSELVRNLAVPWAFVAGQKDLFVPLETAREMAAPLDPGHYFEVPDTGHMPMLEAPETVTQALRVLLSDTKVKQD